MFHIIKILVFFLFCVAGCDDCKGNSWYYDDLEEHFRQQASNLSDGFLEELHRINKYKQIVELDDCNHDEKNHTEEEMALMSRFSRAMLYATNKLRTDPEHFLHKIKNKRRLIQKTLKYMPYGARSYAYYDDQILIINGEIKVHRYPVPIYEGLKPYDEAIEVLEEMVREGSNLEPFEEYEPLIKSSLLHVKAMAKHGFCGHSGICWPIDKTKDRINTGKKPLVDGNEGFNCLSTRVQWFGPDLRGLGENLTRVNIFYNSYTNIYDFAEENIIDLFVDDGVSDRGHRKLLLDNDMTHLGAAIYEHKYSFENYASGYYTTVMNFCKEKI